MVMYVGMIYNIIYCSFETIKYKKYEEVAKWSENEYADKISFGKKCLSDIRTRNGKRVACDKWNRWFC